MKESKKKPIMIAVIVGSLLLAGVITYMTRSGDASDLSSLKGQTVWLKCAKCEGTFPMDKKDYYEYVSKNLDPATMAPPPITCKECGEDSAYLAVKCAKCGHIFFSRNLPNDFSDRCPECNYSEVEEQRKR